MKNSLIKLLGLMLISVLLSACGGGGGSGTAAAPESTATTNLSFMVDGIIAENLDHPDHATWNLDNFDVNDDIDGNSQAETSINTMIDEMVLSDQQQQ